jgi:3-oxoacyl-[acyl-carrier protein] reductase
MNVTLEGKVALVTGAARGIGNAIAARFVAEGARAILVDIDAAALDAARSSLEARGGAIAVISGDVADPSVARAAVAEATARFGTVDVLVNSAGIITRTPFEALSQDEYRRVIDVNLHGAFHFCQCALPIMRAKGSGKVINITSQMAKLPHPSAAVSYEISKAGLSALTRHLAFQYAAHGVCVNSIAPGSIDTDMPKSMTPDAREALRNRIPAKRLGLPEEVAACALFLATPMSDYITGATIDVNGGSFMV